MRTSDAKHIREASCQHSREPKIQQVPHMSQQSEPAGSNEQTINKVDAQPGQSAEQSELEKVKDSFLRLTADFQNARKRMAQDINRRAAIAKEEFIRELLPVIDNLERALTSTANSTQ